MEDAGPQDAEVSHRTRDVDADAGCRMQMGITGFRVQMQGAQGWAQEGGCRGRVCAAGALGHRVQDLGCRLRI